MSGCCILQRLHANSTTHRPDHDPTEETGRHLARLSAVLKAEGFDYLVQKIASWP